MDILTSKCSDRFMAHVRKRRDQEAVRWYVLTLPLPPVAGVTRSSLEGLDVELSRRERRGEGLVRYFSPSCRGEEGGRQDGQHETALLYNYVFIHASENEIFSLKRTLPVQFPTPGFLGWTVLLSPTSRIVRWRDLTLGRGVLLQRASGVRA